MNTSELRDTAQDLVTRDRHSPVFQGFNYFSTSDIGYRYWDDNDNCEFIVALDENNDIIGVLKYSIEIWNASYDSNIRQDTLFTCMRYINVKQGYKGNGLGKKLIQFLDNILDKSIPLFITGEDGEGRTVGTHRMFRKYMTDTEMLFYVDHQYQIYT
jgi:GNAT superfamily N-acetyltransferase